MPVMHREKELIKPETEGSQGCTLECKCEKFTFSLETAKPVQDRTPSMNSRKYHPAQAARSRQHREAQIQGPLSRILSPDLPCSQQHSVLQAPGLYLL